MKKFRLILAIAVVTMMLLQSVAFAAMPNGTVVIGDKAYTLDYVNSTANASTIEAAIAAAGSNVFVKGFSGNWSKVDGTAVTAADIPAVTYLDKDGNSTPVVSGDGDVDVPTITGGSVVDYKTLKVNFNEAVKGTPTAAVYVGGVAQSDIVVTLSEDKKSALLTLDAGFAAGTYNVVINGLTDLNGNAMAANAPVDIAKAASYVAGITSSTSGVAYNNASAPVVLNFVDQYGKSMSAIGGGDAISATALVGSVPLATSYNAGTNSVTIDTSVVAKGSSIAVTIINTNGGATKATLNKTLTVGEAAVATSISAVTTSGTPAAATNGTATATVLDQYGNPITVGPTDIRWTTSNTGVVGLNGGATTFVDGSQAGFTINYLATGTATITAYLKSDITKQASASVTVAANALALLLNNDVVVSGFNKEAVVVDRVTGTTGAILTPDMLKYEVTSAPTDVAKTELTVTFAYGTGDNASKIYATAKTTTAGAFTFVPYVGASYSDSHAVKAAAITYTTTINPAVSSISLAAIGANDLSAEKAIDRAITFTNKNGEVLNVQLASITINKSPNLTVVPYTANADGTINAPAGLGTDVVKYLRITAAASGINDVISVAVLANSASTIINTTSVAKAAPKTISLGTSSITVIKGDTMDVATTSTSDLTVMDTGVATYSAVKLNVFDQYGALYTFTNNTDGYKIKVTPTVAAPAAANFVYLTSLADDSNQALDSSFAVPYLGVNAPTTAIAQAYTVKLLNGSDEVLSTATLQVNVTDARALTTLKSSVSAASVVKGASKATTITGEDQYGKAFVLDPAKIKMVAASSGEYTAASNAGVVTITGVTPSATAYNAVVYYDADASGALDNSEKSVTIPLTVKEAGDIISTIAIQKTVAESTLAGTAADLTKYKAFITNGAANTYTFTTKAFDAANTEVILNASDVTYSIISQTLKINDTSIASNKLSMTGAVLTIDASDALVTDSITGTVVVRAISTNGKTNDMTLTFSNAAAAAQNGGYYATTTEGNADTAVTAVSLVKSTTKNIYISGTDQYGQYVNVPETNVLGFGRDNTSFFTVAKPAAVAITATATTGVTNLHIFIDGNNTIDLAVTVTAE